jgi:integrase
MQIEASANAAAVATNSVRRHKTRHRGIYFRNGADDPKAAAPRRYIVWFEDSDAKGRTETLPLGSTEKDALDRQAELRGKKARGERVAPARVTLKDFTEAWLAEQLAAGRLKAKTHEDYSRSLRLHVLPHIGRRRLQEVTIDDVAALVTRMQRDGKKAWTIRAMLTPLSRVFASAVRRGVVSANPVRGLDKSERPRSDQKRMQILTTVEITKLLEAATAGWQRTLLATLAFTGMRISEALRLTWGDVDFTMGLVTVQTSKTEAGEGREIVLMPSLGRLLREHKLSSGMSLEEHPVFPSATGRQRDRRNVLRWALEPAREAIGSDITLHGLRHTFASILIGQGMDVTFVAAQLGHADPAITLRLYAKLFDPVARRDEARAKLETAFGAVV